MWRPPTLRCTYRTFSAARRIGSAALRPEASQDRLLRGAGDASIPMWSAGTQGGPGRAGVCADPAGRRPADLGPRSREAHGEVRPRRGVATQRERPVSPPWTAWEPKMGRIVVPPHFARRSSPLSAETRLSDRRPQSRPHLRATGGQLSRRLLGKARSVSTPPGLTAWRPSSTRPFFLRP